MAKARARRAKAPSPRATERERAREYADENYQGAGAAMEALAEAEPGQDPDAVNFERKQSMVSKPQRGPTVTVGLNLPMGLVLRLQTLMTFIRPDRSGAMIEVKEWVPNNEAPTYTLNGNRVPVGQAPRCIIQNGYAMTRGIPADFWKAWYEQNKHTELVKNGVIVAHEDFEHVMDEAKDLASAKRPTGFEPVNQAGDPRAPRRQQKVDGKDKSIPITGGVAAE